jgi:hypothetical protein
VARGRELMRASHVLLDIEPITAYTISSKLFEYLAAGRPIILMAQPGSENEQLIQQSGAGTNIGLDDAERLATAIRDRWVEWRDGRLGVTVDQVWLSQFHRRNQVRTLASLLDEATSLPRSR